MMSSLNENPTQHLVLYFQVHQPRRLKSFQFFDIGSHADYFDDELNASILKRIAKDCYLPANALLLKLITKNPTIKITFSVSGILIDQLELYAPEVLTSFRELADTGNVEFLAETYYHSLACLVQDDEFEVQVAEHVAKVEKYFGVRPTILRNTELIYSNEVGNRAQAMGFEGMFCDGVDRILGNRTPHQVYKHPQHDDMRLLLRNYFLSDDIAFRFKQGDAYLSVDRFIAVLSSIPSYLPVINLGLDYETFGEHHKKETGVFKFLEGLLIAIVNQNKFILSKPSEVLEHVTATDVLDVPDYISWADEARDLSAWLGNAMQRDAFDTLLKLARDIKLIEQPAMLKTWRHLLTSDHFYYMSTKKNSDGEVHAYFSHFSSPYEAFINYMNMLADFSQQVQASHASFIDAQANVKLMEAERKQHETVPLWAERMATAYGQSHISR